MKKLTPLLFSALLFFNGFTQNKIENKSYEVAYAAVIDLSNNTKTDITNLSPLETKKQNSDWGTEVTSFGFYIGDEEHFFMSNYDKDSLEDGSLVQKYKQTYVTNKAEILVYYSEEPEIENGIEFNIGIILPDLDYGRLFLFQVLDEDLAIQNKITQNKELILDNPNEAAHWEKFEKMIAEIANSNDIGEFKGEEDTKSFFPDIYKVDLKQTTSLSPGLSMNYTERRNIYSDKLMQNLNINVFSLENWISPKRSKLLRASDIAKTEALFDKYLLDDYIKVYKPATSDEFDYDVLGKKERGHIMDDIYYINKKEKNISLSKLQMSFVKIELEENILNKETTWSAQFNKME